MRCLLTVAVLFSLVSASKSSAEINMAPKDFVVHFNGYGPKIHGHFDNFSLADFSAEKDQYACSKRIPFRRFQFVGSQDVLMYLGKKEYKIIEKFLMTAAFHSKKACENADLSKARIVGNFVFQNKKYPDIKVAVAYNALGRIEVLGPANIVFLGYLLDSNSPAPTPTPAPPAPTPTPAPPAPTPTPAPPAPTPTPAPPAPTPTPAPPAPTPTPAPPAPTPTPAPTPVFN